MNTIETLYIVVIADTHVIRYIGTSEDAAKEAAVICDRIYKIQNVSLGGIMYNYRNGIREIEWEGEAT